MSDGIKKCPFCAEDIKAEAVKCKHCGSVIEKTEESKSKVPAVSTQSPTSNPPSNPNTGLIIGGVCLLVAIFLIVLLIKSSGKPHKPPLVECKGNMKFIATELDMYGSSNGGLYPESLQILVDKGYAVKLHTCPTSGESYSYIRTGSDGAGYTLECKTHGLLFTESDYPMKYQEK